MRKQQNNTDKQDPADLAVDIGLDVEPVSFLPAIELEALFLRGYVRAMTDRPEAALADLKIAEKADPHGFWGMRAGFIVQRLEE